MASVLAVGCVGSVSLFALVDHQVRSLNAGDPHWLAWVVLVAGLALTFHSAYRLLSALDQAVRHEDLVQSTTRELSAHRDRTREVLARIRDAVVVTDGAGFVLEWNQAAERTLGRRAHEAVGRHCSVALDIRSVDRPLDCRATCALMAAAGDDADGAGVEVLRERADGQTQRLLATAGAVSEDGRVTEVVHSLRDMTRLRQADDAKTMFLATTSHELRTPLTIIRGFAEMLAVRDVDEHIRATALNTILERVEQLTSIVDRVLLASRTERVGAQVQPEFVDAAAVVAACVHEARSSFDREITVARGTGSHSAWADPAGLRTVVEHLIENAVKYSPDGGSIEVQVADHTPEDEHVTVSVTDHGIGMDAEDRAHCFDRFWQADQGDDRRFGGTGVGLYLVRSLVEAMSGTITVDSTPGEGSTFVVTLRTEEPAEPPSWRPLSVPHRRASLVDDVLRHTGVGGPN